MLIVCISFEQHGHRVVSVLKMYVYNKLRKYKFFSSKLLLVVYVVFLVDSSFVCNIGLSAKLICVNDVVLSLLTYRHCDL